ILTQQGTTVDRCGLRCFGRHLRMVAVIGSGVVGLHMNIEIRKAKPEDSLILAELMNIAGDGIPAYLWAGLAEPGENVMDFGARRVARAEGGFSYSNVHVAVVSGTVAGMLLGYRLPDTHEAGQLERSPAVVRPLLALEALAPGSWYVN